MKIKSLALWIAFPILVSGAFTVQHWWVRSSGQLVDFPVEGFDPRDLISGHYIQFKVNYGVADVCASNFGSGRGAYICLSTNQFSYSKPSHCSSFIEGKCEGSVFTAGIERYYASEQRALQLQTLLRDKKISIRVSVTDFGRAQIVSLLIDGQETK